MAEAVKKPTRQLTRVTAAQFDALRTACDRLARCTGARLPEEMNSLSDIIPVISSLADVCSQRITLDRQKHQESTRIREELENVERLKTRFIRNVSHELRTPLASIEGFARALMRMESSDGAPASTSSGELLTPESRKQFCAIISQEAQRLGKLIEDVLDLSEIESKRSAHEACMFTAKELFTAVVTSFDSSQMPLQVSMRLTPEPEGPTIYADRDAMIEVVRQLVSNGQKFSAGQEVIVGADLVSISPNSIPASISGQMPRVSTATRIYVRDRGIGVPKEELENIFEKFYRVERPGFAVPGTGLGLSIVRALVNQSNGQVWCESELGHGSTFYVLLPNKGTGSNINSAISV